MIARGYKEMSSILADQQRTLYMSPCNCGGGGGCGVSANENSCAHHVTWSPNKQLFNDDTSVYPPFGCFLIASEMSSSQATSLPRRTACWAQAPLTPWGIPTHFVIEIVTLQKYPSRKTIPLALLAKGGTARTGWALQQNQLQQVYKSGGRTIAVFKHVQVNLSFVVTFIFLKWQSHDVFPTFAPLYH